jgi:hypothetical protein
MKLEHLDILTTVFLKQLLKQLFSGNTFSARPCLPRSHREERPPPPSSPHLQGEKMNSEAPPPSSHRGSRIRIAKRMEVSAHVFTRELLVSEHTPLQREKQKRSCP